MATNFGGLPTECYICCRKPRKLQAISLRRFGALLPLVRFAQPAEVRLRSALVPPFAQNDIQNFCFVVIVRMDDLMEGGKPPRDCKQSLRPTMNFNVFVGAIHESPVFYTRYAFVLGGRRAPALQKTFFNTGASLTLHSAFCTLHSLMLYIKIIFSLRIKLPIRRDRASRMCQALRP